MTRTLPELAFHFSLLVSRYLSLAAPQHIPRKRQPINLPADSTPVRKRAAADEPGGVRGPL